MTDTTNQIQALEQQRGQLLFQKRQNDLQRADLEQKARALAINDEMLHDQLLSVEQRLEGVYLARQEASELMTAQKTSPVAEDKTAQDGPKPPAGP